ncbi:APC family permease [Lactobacillus johnsonii]|uniref:APC family permease n=1 Tax=Lactobacillus johnsonii TaxID=33959 RepID=UPI003CFFF386
MNVAIIAGLGNDVQEAFYGLSSVTYFAIGAICFFIPTALVAAELASGWSNRGGIFRWVGEGLGKGWALTCLLILWFQVMINFGMGMPSSAATILFYTPMYNKAVAFAQNPTHVVLIMTGWIILYWIMAIIANKGVKTFTTITKYGVLIGTLIPLAVMIILTIVWLCQGHTPAISMAPKQLIPKWNGMSTLALAAGVFFSYTGIDENAAFIKRLRHPEKDFVSSIFITLILVFLIFVVGTVIIAMIVPEKQINVLYSLVTVFKVLGETFAFPWLYLVLMWVGLFNLVASTVTELAAPSVMLAQAGGSGFLPKWLQKKNKHGMPARLVYVQMAGMTIIAYLFKLIPNVEGFVILLTQCVTVLYLFYYILMFVAFLRLRYQQPNRPRSFKVPGGKVGAWIIAGVGLISSIFGIVLAFYPPAQVKAEVGSPVTYIIVIAVLVAVVLLTCLGLYLLSKKHPNWVNPKNEFAPFTWEIEGLPKPEKVTSNIPTVLMSKNQNPMGMPIKRPYKPDQQVAKSVVDADEQNESVEENQS